ncbi:hypothetical protein L195_g044702 [Trifolium pratense]|uniref:Uncharacterized protein n=1 Tax=Trifolium pratense TaxID=57577 RepID=A0A2K3MCV4_TRIPR|nr:hypothetical protein L195_g044702 [Trifolium pratense]
MCTARVDVLVKKIGAIEEFKTKAGIDHRWRPWGGGWVKRGNGKGGAGARKGGQGSDRSSSGGNAGEGGAQSGVMNKTKAEKRKKLELMEEDVKSEDQTPLLNLNIRSEA